MASGFKVHAGSGSDAVALLPPVGPGGYPDSETMPGS